MNLFNNKSFKNLRRKFFLQSKVTNAKTFCEKHHKYAKCFEFMEKEKYYTGWENKYLQSISAI